MTPERRSPHDDDGHTPLCQVATSKFEEMDRRITQSVVALDERVDQRFVETEKRLCQKFLDMDRRLDQRSELNQAAIHKAETAMDIRLEALNAFRHQLSDERKTYMTKTVGILVNFIISLLLVAIGLFFAHLVGK